MRRGPIIAALILALTAAALATLSQSPAMTHEGMAREPSVDQQPTEASQPDDAGGEVTLAFAGDIHFESTLATLLDDPDSDLGPLSRTLRQADVAVVNLESALTRGGNPASKELEDPAQRYWFRAAPSALGVLNRSGVDVASMANNHGADYGLSGLRDSLRVAQQSPVGVIGVGRNIEDAFEPYRTTVNGTDVAVIAADGSMRESRNTIWGATNSDAGIASARGAAPARLLEEVSEVSQEADITVVYMHWGAEGAGCSTPDQNQLAQNLANAGADVVVGAHSHTVLGSGMIDDTYVHYGLGNFLWYHGSIPDTGVLQLRFRGGDLIGEDWVPGRIPVAGGQPERLRGAEATAARGRWEAARACTNLRAFNAAEAERAAQANDLPRFESSVERIDNALARRIASSHNAARCPVPLSRLRYLQVSYVDFQGEAQQGEIIVHADYADDIVSVFRTLYRARWQIRQMRLVSDFGSNDDRSMAANNSSGFNCRTVFGQQTWSQHAYGTAIDLNPVQNPYLTGGQVLPPRGERFADVDRSLTANPRRGVIHDGDVVVRAFERIGWTWGGRWSDADYQHFNAPS